MLLLDIIKYKGKNLFLWNILHMHIPYIFSEGEISMRLIKIINYIIIFLYITLILNTFFPILKFKASLEKKIMKITTNIFLILFIWSIYRFVNRIAVVNIYDYLIIILNGGLLVVAFLNSRHV